MENKNKIVQIYNEKVKNIKKHNKFYFAEDKPKISDRV